jgi:small subunit ribosomal protein S20
MPNIQSAKKRMRQNEKRRTLNRAQRSSYRSSLRKLRDLIVAGDAEAARNQMPGTIGALGTAAQKGLIARKKASRQTSRLTLAVNAMQAASPAAEPE